jgi:hypothetical protein
VIDISCNNLLRNRAKINMFKPKLHICAKYFSNDRIYAS